MFEAVKLHEENVNRNPRKYTLRIGRKVPESAVNLAYYANKRATLDERVLIAKAPKNTIHRTQVDTYLESYGELVRNDLIFPLEVPYGDDTGYTGTLKRIKVRWTENKHELSKEVVYDADPIIVAAQEVPETLDYQEGEYSGELTLMSVEYIPLGDLWRAITTYSGTIYKRWSDFDGRAYYYGTVTKRTVVGITNPEGHSEFIMYADELGILRHELGGEEIDSDLFYITDMFKDDVPLYYMYKLRYPVYDRQGPDEYGMYRGNSIKLVNSVMKPLNKTKYKYQIKLEPYKAYDPNYANMYNVFIYTSFITTTSKTIYSIYNAYDYSTSSKPSIKHGIVEGLNAQPFYIRDTDYRVTPIDVVLKKNYIRLLDSLVIPDSRNKLHFLYVVKTTDGVYSSDPINGTAINKTFALNMELKDFVDRNYIVSPKVNSGYASAYDIIVDHCGITSESALQNLKSKTFKAELYLSDAETLENRFKLNLHTDPNGLGPVSVETTEATGFYNPENGKNDKLIALPGKYKIIHGRIHPAYAVKCRDVRVIECVQPRESNLLENWYVRIRSGHFNQVIEHQDVRSKVIYSIPEFNEQEYSSLYEKPYVDVVGESAQIIDSHTIKTKLSPLYVTLNDFSNPTNIRVQRVSGDGSKKFLTVASWSFTEGLIETYELLNDNDNIEVDYTYEEQSYTYRGFYDSTGRFIDIEFNPNQYHTYLDNTSETPVRKEVYNLFNAVVYFFLRPYVKQTLDGNGYPIAGTEVINKKTLYHKINNPDPDEPDHLMIGSVYVKHCTSLKDTELIDTRTRGGGLIKEMTDQIRRELEPESDYYWDIGFHDGEPYTENAVVVIRLDRRILKQYGGRFSTQDVDKAIHKWIAAGVEPIVEYVQTFTADELPQASLTTTSDYQNKVNYTPHLFISTESID